MSLVALYRVGGVAGGAGGRACHEELPSPRARSAQKFPRAQVEGRGSQPG
jgi:hypothetical protein